MAAPRSSSLLYLMSFRSHHRIALGCVTLLAVAGLGLVASEPLPGTPREASAAPGDGRPNIVLIQTDDQAYMQLSRRRMPNVTRLLSRHGTRFTDYIASTAQCCPSRASLITGQYAHNHGVTSNPRGYRALVDKRNVLPVWLQQAGYRTLHLGKFLNGYEEVADPPSEVAPGWKRWHSVLGHPRYYHYNLFVDGTVQHHGGRRDDHVTGVLNRAAVRLVKRYAPKWRPFYLQLDQPAPHVALQRNPHGRCDRAPIPMPAHKRLFRNAALPNPPSYNEAQMSDKPSFLRGIPRAGPSEAVKIRKHWRCALASLRGVDRGVEKIFNAVKEAGELRKTIFIFTSDNGQFHGQHRIRTGKVLPYEEALNLPFVIRMPRRYREGAKRVAKVRETVANIDLAPTILRLARARPCSAAGPCRTMDGRSLMPLLTHSGRWPQNRGLLTEYRVGTIGGRYATCEFTGIRTRQTIYVRHTRVVNPSTGECEPADQRERYDLRVDPFELDNMCFGGAPASCPLGVAQLRLEQRLSRLQGCAGISGRDQRVGQRPFCE
jgi:N-acetylglucosamine-6-sulfatase